MVLGCEHASHGVVCVGGAAPPGTIYACHTSATVPVVYALYAAVVLFRRYVARKVTPEDIPDTGLVDHLAQAVHPVVAETHPVPGFLAPCHAPHGVVAHADMASRVTRLRDAVVAVVAEVYDVTVTGVYAPQAVQSVIHVELRAVAGRASLDEPAPGIMLPAAEQPPVLVP